jgi:DNA-binding transcriptional LysR family regulator
MSNDGGAPGLSGALDLNQLRTFLAVYRTGSFTAAARLLGLSQPTVTMQIRALERQLGRPLYERLPTGAAPSVVADELAAETAGPLDALAALEDRSRGAAEGTPAAPVHLAGPAELVCLLVLPALAPLVGQGLRLRISLGLADDLLDGLQAGSYDLVVSAVRPRGRALSAVPLMDEEFVLVAAPAWAERIGPGRVADGGPAALRGVPLISYSEELPIVRRYWRHVFGVRLTGTAAVVVPDLRGVLAAVLAGAGVSVLPRYLCRAQLASGELVPLLEVPDAPINTGFLVRRTGAHEPPQTAMVRERLLQAARDW